jgi:FimV-like protein
MPQYNQILFYIHTYQFPITFGATLFVMLLSLTLIRSRRKQLQKIRAVESHLFKNSDIEMFAGDDVVTTQLDLARAYIEMGKSKLAKTILLNVSKQGKPDQKSKAKELISTL